MTFPPRARIRGDAARGWTFAMVWWVHGGEDRHSPLVLEGQLLPLNILESIRDALSEQQSLVKVEFFIKKSHHIIRLQQ